MTKENFALKLISIIIIVAALFYYNQMMSLAAELGKANEEIEKVIDMQKELNAQAIGNNSEAKDADENVAGQEAKYLDGIHEGVGQGYGGDVEVQITIESGTITDIEVTSAENEDVAYYNMAIDVIDKAIETQSAEVDVVSGATYTSTGILDAIEDALNKAVN